MKEVNENKINSNIFSKVQPFIIVLLFLGFLFSFGLPAFSTFSKKNVMFVESSNNSDILVAPALTICVENVRIISKPFSIKIYYMTSGGSSKDRWK